jgi:ring-1,2-phenylacetyl-CoA epoxidase subunit PaaC
MAEVNIKMNRGPQAMADPKNRAGRFLFDYTLMLADNALILGHRNSEWTGNGPNLEQDIAISNIALDLIGQARNTYQYAANLLNNLEEGSQNPKSTEDTLAYLRDAGDFRNCQLVEQPKGDWARTILRQFLFSAYQFYIYQKLQASSDSVLAGICEKAFKEVSYHLRWSAEWVIRLGDGTVESRRRLLSALDDLWKFIPELFRPTEYESEMAACGKGVDPQSIHGSWLEKIKEVFTEAGIELPGGPDGRGWHPAGGKEGIHTEALGYILAEMQFLQRAYPGCTW